MRLHRRPDGTIVTKSCFAPVLRAGRFVRLKIGLAAVAFWSAVSGAWWARRPSPSVIESADSADAETRRLPFMIKPPDDSESDWADVLRRPTHKPQAKKPVRAEAEFTVVLGGIGRDDE